jgi:hypothetical protein
MMMMDDDDDDSSFVFYTAVTMGYCILGILNVFFPPPAADCRATYFFEQSTPTQEDSSSHHLSYSKHNALGSVLFTDDYRDKTDDHVSCPSDHFDIVFSRLFGICHHTNQKQWKSYSKYPVPETDNEFVENSCLSYYE